MQRVIRPDLAAIADQGVVSLANFLTGVILARTLSPDQFGLYTLGLTVILLVLELQTTVTTTPYMVLSPHLAPEAKATYLGSTSAHQAGLGAIVAIGLVITGGLLEILGSSALGRVMLVLGLVSSFILFRDFVRRIDFAHLKPDSALLLDTVVTVLQLGGLLVLSRTGGLTVARSFLVIGVAAGIPAVVWVTAKRDGIRFSMSSMALDLKRNWQFGRWLLMSGSLWSLTLYLYPWLLAVMHGTSATAVWAVGVGVVAVGNPLLLGYQNHLGPRIMESYARKDADALRQTVARGSRIYAAIMSPLVFGLAVFGGTLAPLIYGDSYSGNGWLIGLLAVNLLVSAMAYPYSRGLFAIERADVDFKINLVALASLILVGVWLVQLLGPVGAAWGMLLANVVASAIRVRAFHGLVAVKSP